MISKKLVIPSLFVVLMLTLLLIFGSERSRPRTLEAHQLNSVAP
jgi:hypothetical protein